LVKPRNLLDDFVDLVQLVFTPWWVTMMADQAGLAKGHRTPEHTTSRAFQAVNLMTTIIVNV